MVHVAGSTIILRKGESLHTENSYKYREDSLQWMARQAGFELEQLWCDENNYFALVMLKAIE